MNLNQIAKLAPQEIAGETVILDLEALIADACARGLITLQDAHTAS